MLLEDTAATVELGGRRVQIVGVDPRTYRRGRSHPERLADPDADLRILLCHFPNVIDKVPPGVFDLVLAGHLHGGQICVPYGFGKLRLAHLRWTYAEGLYRRPGGVLHVSPGSGHDVCSLPLLRPARSDRAPSYTPRRDHPRRRTHRRDSRAGPSGLPRLRLVAVERRACAEQARLDRRRRGGVGSVGRRLLRRRRPDARVDAVRAGRPLSAGLGAARRAAVGGRRSDHVRLSRRPGDAVGPAVTVPGRDRRRQGQAREGARDVRLPVRGGGIGLRAVPRASHRVPTGLSLRLRLRDRAPGGADRARAARPRRLAADRRRQSRQGPACGQRGICAGAGARASGSLVGPASASASSGEHDDEHDRADDDDESDDEQCVAAHAARACRARRSSAI